MPAPAPLDDAGLERLGQLLDRRAVPFGGLSLEALDGFLSALMVSPEMVLPSEWQPGIFGDKPPRWDSLEEATEVQTLLMGFWNLISERVRQEAPDREDLLPVIWMPETEDGEDENSVAHDWALGFLRGIGLRKAAWDVWLEEEPWILDGYVDIISLVTGEQQFDADGKALDESRPLPIDDRREIVLDLPWLLIDLHHHRIEAMTPRTPIRRETTTGRNDPCPCGSGKKFKKCCGA
jgi:uncharacterized protein